MEEMPKSAKSDEITNLTNESVKKVKFLNKNTAITILIIIVILIGSYFILNKNPPQTTKEIAECIGKNSVLYVQLGCSHCKDQEDMFGDNLQYITKVDCFYEKEKCQELKIPGTPTWIINEKQYVGVQSIEKLQELTNCK
jgi:hypothetical protein